MTLTNTSLTAASHDHCFCQTSTSGMPTCCRCGASWAGASILSAPQPTPAPTPALEPFAGEAHNGRYRWERPALSIVEDVKKHLLPAMEEEQGGWLLGQILDLTMRVRDETLALAAAPSPAEKS